MSVVHEVMCDVCRLKAQLNYNGEHYLPPDGWLRLYDDNKAKVLNYNLCPKCVPVIPGKKKVKKG